MSKLNEVIIETRSVKKDFKGPGGIVHVLEGVDLVVKVGETVSIRGESGAGKSTFLNIITLLERCDQGEVLWEGKVVSDKPNGWLAKKRGELFGLVFQSHYLIPELNALENVLIVKRLQGRLKVEDQQRAKNLLEVVGLKRRAGHLPSQLSGGESQRVAIARALMNGPKVIVADEPTGSLDEKTGADVMKLLLDVCSKENVSLVLVTHNPEYAKMTQRRGVLHLGRLLMN